MPERVGEVALPLNGGNHEVFVLGRSPRRRGRPLELMRQRPGGNMNTGSPESSGISRVQWLVRRCRGGLEIENAGRRPLRCNGVQVEGARVVPGDLVEIDGELLALVVSRPSHIPARRLPDTLVPPFGQADQFGIVGEAPALWELRRQLAFAAGRDHHVLLTGASGTGKELAARVIHGMSGRAARQMVARNAATFPEGLIDAELFGNVRDYPNPGMPERPGLIGTADGATLFLDEIGELPHGLQAHLLRVLEGGEYQRLGESRTRRANVRVVAATNRPATDLKHDLLARLRLRLALPGLEQRREDVPLLARHLLRSMATADPEVAEAVFPDGDCRAEPRWSASFVGALVTARYTTHVRELESILWQAVIQSSGGVLDEVPSVPAAPPPPAAEASPAPVQEVAGSTVDPQTITAERLQAALDASGGVREHAWRALGLRSRHQLLRLMRKHGLSPAP